MPPGTIYVITNTVNGKQYVGQTIKTITQRWSEHCSQASAPRRARTALPAAIRKYGADVFTIEAIYELIATSMQPDLDAAEAIFIELFQTMAPDGYNLVHGGRGGARSAEAREHMSLAKQNQSQETRAKISANRRGKIHSPDARARMSASQRRRFERDGVSSATRQRLSVASKNRIRTPEHGARISAALKGRPRSPETVAKMKATKAARRGTYKKRAEYANDLGDPEHLIAVSARMNRQKGDRGPATWLPPRTRSQCRYVRAWQAITSRWALTVSPADSSAMQQLCVD